MVSYYIYFTTIKRFYISTRVGRNLLWGFPLGSKAECGIEKVLVLFCWNFLSYTLVIFIKNKTNQN